MAHPKLTKNLNIRKYIVNHGLPRIRKTRIRYY